MNEQFSKMYMSEVIKKTLMTMNDTFQGMYMRAAIEIFSLLNTMNEQLLKIMWMTLDSGFSKKWCISDNKVLKYKKQFQRFCVSSVNCQSSVISHQLWKTFSQKKVSRVLKCKYVAFYFKKSMWVKVFFKKKWKERRITLKLFCFVSKMYECQSVENVTKSSQKYKSKCCKTFFKNIDESVIKLQWKLCEYYDESHNESCMKIVWVLWWRSQWKLWWKHCKVISKI